MRGHRERGDLLLPVVWLLALAVGISHPPVCDASPYPPRPTENEMSALSRLADELDRRDYEMGMTQGESPRPRDYSEGHYVGVRYGLREAAQLARDMDAERRTR